ncbi:MAG: bifunctional phosphopantothenoylcysteine decarboxylase/phosphopantothenate--cysteine ligase CoaBC [Candidatus Nitronauta litoralis]|uniref:Coenzyme A biosynthesis bifunctional protein CoaBC n=1 Tax=Candidatus Nitronauta litoralis TaxID=2705533 RepID=A0A7T0BYH0_9BACT|nr:MAG: bifunctional phosphopantothenoylcysteine decarboxylase/phosphopantothenate--cysteine ligase CoaBC [Candidatus Nitronauta litoralis]
MPRESFLSGKRIALGVSGGIAAYKSAELLRLLQKSGAEVSVLMTPGAKQFITPLTFEALSGQLVYHEIFEEGAGRMEHIVSAGSTDLLLVAPLTANTLAKMARGLADDPVSITYSAFKGPVVVAPAMNDQMWAHAAVQDNIRILKARGVTVVEPEAGELACGAIGPGRLAELEVILKAVATRLEQAIDFKGKHVLVTAGPTCEPIDPVRFITNRSSGKMGYAIADKARLRGADVTLISGPTALTPPCGVRFLSCERVSEMRDLVMEHIPGCDVLVMTAAVGDFAPREINKEKIKKKGDASITLEMIPTPDILKEVSALSTRPFVVGFAAESENVLENALDKMDRKKLDMIVANDISAPGIGFQSEENQVTVISGPGDQENLPRMLKVEIADRLLNRILSRL